MTDDATQFGFKYVNLSEIDPNFTPVDEAFYNLRVTKAELRSYVSTKDTKTLKTGDTGEYVNFRFTITGHEKFSGRTLFESLFPNEFTFKVLRRVQDATGVQQTGSLEDWLKELTSISPTIKVKITKVPDVYRDGTANPKTAKPDGTPSDKNVVDWKAGVQPGDAQ